MCHSCPDEENLEHANLSDKSLLEVPWNLSVREKFQSENNLVDKFDPLGWDKFSICDLRVPVHGRLDTRPGSQMVQRYNCSDFFLYLCVIAFWARIATRVCAQWNYSVGSTYPKTVRTIQEKSDFTAILPDTAFPRRECSGGASKSRRVLNEANDCKTGA